MTNETWELFLQRELHRTKMILGSKAIEYAGENDRLHNFKKAAQIACVLPVIALDGMMLKHYTAYRDMLDDVRENDASYTLARLDERFGDMINYLLLQKALFMEYYLKEPLDAVLKPQEYGREEREAVARRVAAAEAAVNQRIGGAWPTEKLDRFQQWASSGARTHEPPPSPRKRFIIDDEGVRSDGQRDADAGNVQDNTGKVEGAKPTGTENY